MNRNCYRIVFNANRGQLMAVSETSTRTGKSAAGERSAPPATHTARVSGSKPLAASALALALWSVFGQAPLAWAQVVADPNAPANQRPTVLSDSQGRPLVNIQTPSASGLSRNTYSQFDVTPAGIVLNNSASNPWLSNGVVAKTILNEVNSLNPSLIKGAITVNGTAARVIVANPKGIAVDGGSFVNASRATLTTGSAVVSSTGALTGFTVKQGAITIGEGGLNNSATPFTDLMSRAIVLNGKLQAKELSLTTGLQTVTYDTGLISNQNTTPNTTGAFAIDTAALGGMYANNISLLATEAGLGVRNKGTWQASGGQIVVTADGKLVNTGSVSAGVGSLATVNGNIENSGSLKADKALVLSAGADVHLAGAGMVQDTGSTVIVNAKGDVRLHNTEAYGTARIVSTESGGQISISAGKNVVVGKSSQIAAHRSVQLSSDEGMLLDHSSIVATEGNVTALSSGTLYSRQSQVTGQNVHLETGAVFKESAAPLIVEGGNIRGSQQTTVLSSGWMGVEGAGSPTPISGAGHVAVQSAQDLSIAPNTRIAAGQNMSVTAGGNLFLLAESLCGCTGINGKTVTLQAGGNMLVAGNSIQADGANIAAGKELSLEAYKGNINLRAIANTTGTQADRVKLSAGGDLNVATFDGKLYAKGIEATGTNIHVVGNGFVGFSGRSLKSGENTTTLGSVLTAKNGITLANINNTAGLNSQVEMFGTQVNAAGKVQVLSHGDVLLGAQTNTVDGVNSAAGTQMTAGSIAIVGSKVRTYASDLYANGDKTSKAKSGNIDITATDSTALFAGHQGSFSQFNATGNIALHAQGNLTHSYTKANAGGYLISSSATGEMVSTGAKLQATDQLSLVSQGAQTHTNSTYTGGVSSVYNATGPLALNNTRVNAVGTTTASLSALGAQTRIESGGTLAMDAASYLVGKTGVTVIQGEGDMVMKPSAAANGSFTWRQVSSSGTTTLVARNGDLLLGGVAGTTGAGSSSIVNISTQGNLNLVGNNVTLQGSDLFVDGTVNVDATKGHFIATSLKETQGDSTTASAWNVAYVRGTQGVNIRAAQNISLDGSTVRSTAGSLGLQSGGSLFSQFGTLSATNELTLFSKGEQTHLNNGVTANKLALYAETGPLAIRGNSRLNGTQGITLGALNGDVALAGVAGTTGAGSSVLVNVVTKGNLNVVGNNVSLQGSDLFVDGTVNMDATKGHFTARAMKETEGDSTTASAWNVAYVRGTQGVNIRAAQNISLDGSTVRSTAGSLSLQSGGTLFSQNSSLSALDLFSARSGQAQTHLNSTLQGGASSLYNITGLMSLTYAKVNAIGTSTARFAEMSGRSSVESGGRLEMDRNSTLYGKVGTSFVQGQGDIVINANIRPSDTTVGALEWSQVSSKNMNLVTRNGNIVLKGQEGTNGAGSAGYVSLSTQGDMNLVGNNVTLEGTALVADGTLNITATTGDLIAKGVKESKIQNEVWGSKQAELIGSIIDVPEILQTYSEKVDWKKAHLSGEQGVNIRAAGNIAMDSTLIFSDNTVNVQAGGNLSMAGNYTKTTTDERPVGGWYVEKTGVSTNQISAEKGITLGAMGGDLTLSATNLFANAGPVTLQALGDINLEAAQTYERGEAHIHDENGRAWNKEIVDVYYTNQDLRNVPLYLSGQNILVKAGNNINTYGTQFNAKGNLTLQAGDAINYYGVYAQTERIEDRHKVERNFGIKDTTDSTNSITKLIGQPTKLQSQNDILSQSGADQLLQGTQVVYGGSATFQAGVGEKARADARIILEGLKSSTTQTRTEKSESIVWQKTVDQGSVIETLALPTFSGPKPPDLKAPGGLTVQIPQSAPDFQASGGLTVQIPQGELQSEISKLMKQPGMEYLQSLAQRSDINWQPVKLAHEQWNYQQEGLTGAGAALVAIAVAMVMPAAAGALGGALTGTAATAAGAAMTSLAVQASVSLINNQGNLGKTLKEMGSSQTVKNTVTAALTAGVMDKLGGTDLMKGLADNASTVFTEKLAYNLINNTTRSLTNAVLTGDDLSNALKVGMLTGLVDSAHGQAASKIKLLENDYIVHKLAHALAGCAAGAAVGGQCKDGAIGAAVGEMVAQLMPAQNGIAYSDKEKQNVLGLSKLAAGTVTALAGGNAQTGINTADTAVQSNAFVPVLVGLAWLADKAWTAYEVSQDVAAVRDGTKTVDQLALEKGEEYVTGIILGNVTRYGVKAVKVGGKWVQGKIDNAANINTAQVSDNSGYKPNAGATSSMGAFLESPGFGSALGEASQKMSKIANGVSVYKANEKVGDYIKKGDQFYIDKQHMNHIEVYSSTNKATYVLNLDGSLNVAKTEVARKQGRTIPK